MAPGHSEQKEGTDHPPEVPGPPRQAAPWRSLELCGLGRRLRNLGSASKDRIHAIPENRRRHDSFGWSGAITMLVFFRECSVLLYTIIAEEGRRILMNT